MNFDDTCQQIVEALDPSFTATGYRAPASYTFDRTKVSPEAFKQGTHWFDKTGMPHKITDMSLSHLQGAMGFILDKFPQETGSPLYRALHKQYMRARVKDLRRPGSDYYIRRRQSILSSEP